ncbi:MAG: MoaD/ThiS family protein [Vicinamibacterales bacterium]
MRVTVRVFAQLRDAVRHGQFDADVPPGASVADVWRHLTVSYPELAPFAGSVSCAVNAQFARMTAGVHEGDEIAFLPPVSGG